MLFHLGFKNKEQENSSEPNKRPFQKTQPVCKLGLIISFPPDNVIPDRKVSNTVSQPEDNGLIERISAWAGPKQIKGETDKVHEDTIIPWDCYFLKHFYTLKVCPSSLCDRKKGSGTWVYVAVTHSMDGVLAFSIGLAEEGLSQSVRFGKWTGIRGITQIHHLIDGKEGLVTSLLALAKFLGGKQQHFSSTTLLNKEKSVFEARPSQCPSMSQSPSAAPGRPC